MTVPMTEIIGINWRLPRAKTLPPVKGHIICNEFAYMLYIGKPFFTVKLNRLRSMAVFKSNPGSSYVREHMLLSTYWWELGTYSASTSACSSPAQGDPGCAYSIAVPTPLARSLCLCGYPPMSRVTRGRHQTGIWTRRFTLFKCLNDVRPLRSEETQPPVTALSS